MSIGKIEYNIKQPWTVTQNNFVGPTPDVNFRPESSLINPASNVITKDDVNTIYLDPINGNDINTGFTLALAVKTFNQAVTQITASGRTFIHIDTLEQSIKTSFPTAGFNPTVPSPSGISMKWDGTLWITTTKLGPPVSEVNNVTAAGGLISKFTLLGIIDPVNNSLGITEAPTKNLYVSEFGGGSSNIYLVTPTGGFISQFPTIGFAPLGAGVTGLSYDKSNDSLWVVDGPNQIIYNIGLSGGFKSSFPTSVFGGGTVSGVSVTSDNKLFVSEISTGSIYKIEKNGTLIKSFLTTPTPSALSIVAGNDGTIWVTDPGTRTVNNLKLNPVTDLLVEANLGGLAVDLTGTAIKAQVSPGLTAKVTIDGGYYWTGLGTQLNEFHGLYIDSINPKVPFNVVTSVIPLFSFDFYPPFGVDPGLAGSISWDFKWCDFKALMLIAGGIVNASLSVFRQLAGQTIFNNKVFFASVIGNFDRNIFISDDSTKTWFIMGVSLGAFSITNNTFQNGFAVLQSVGNNISVITIHSNIVNGFTKFNNVTSSIGGTFTPAIEFSLLNFATIDPNIDTTSGNNIFSKNPIFRELGTDFRLQKKGISSETGFIFAFNSPAIQTGKLGVDMGPYDIAYTPGLETYDTLIMDTDGCGIESYDVVKYTENRINYQEWNMVKGAYRNTFDALCAEISFDFAKREFTGTNWTQRFKKMFRATGLKRYFPEGEFGVPLGTGVNNASNAYKLTVTDPDGRLADENNWFDGWVMRISHPVLYFADINTQTLYKTGLDGTLITSNLFTDFEPVGALNITGMTDSPLRERDTIYLVDATGGGTIYHIDVNPVNLITKKLISSINPAWNTPTGIHSDYNGISLSVFDSTINSNIIVRLGLDYTIKYILTDGINFGNPIGRIAGDPGGLLWIATTINNKMFLYDYDSGSITKTIALSGMTTVNSIDVTSGDTIFALDTVLNTVHRLNKSGVAISTFSTTAFDINATNTSAMCVSRNSRPDNDTMVLIKSHVDNVYTTCYLNGSELQFPLTDSAEFYISHLPSLLKMPRMATQSEYYQDSNRTPWSKSVSGIEANEFHFRKWVLKQTVEESFE